VGVGVGVGVCMCVCAFTDHEILESTNIRNQLIP